jgi:polyphosphate kinase
MSTLKYFNRDVSWLKFNKRVLEESEDLSLALYERIKFMAIHASNLDEFYRVRVAYLETMAKLEAYNEEEQVSFTELLGIVRLEAYNQGQHLRTILNEQILPGLEDSGILLCTDIEQLHREHEDEIDDYFNTYVASFLQLTWLTPGNAPFLEDRILYLLGEVDNLEDGTRQYLLVNIPSNALPRFVTLAQRDGVHHIAFIDDILRLGIRKWLLKGRDLDFYSIKLNRDAAIDIDEESGDIAENMRLGLEKRGMGAPSRFQFDAAMPAEMVDFCEQYFTLENEELNPTGRYQSMSDFFGFPNPLKPLLEQKKWKSHKHSQLNVDTNYFEAMNGNDFLLHFPYQSYNHVLIFFNQAVLDPYVTEIMATFYRVAPDSHIVNALISASKNGKKVRAFVEVKARFDEANNLRWADKMMEAGVEITYSLPEIKVHAKTALIIREKDGVRSRYGFFGTGNFNEKTAGIYSDIGLLTANKEMTEELEMVFMYLYNQHMPATFNHLLVSPFNTIEGFKALIQQEIDLVKQGLEGKITIKLNNLEDIEMIDALYEASNAGVKIEMIVRSICRLRPGIPGLSENIRMVRVVGRYLEHSRIFVFHHAGKPNIYLGSADWMRRNLRSRVEVVFPVYDESCREEILIFLQTQLGEYRKTHMLDENLTSHAYDENLLKGRDAQEAFYQLFHQSKK